MDTAELGTDHIGDSIGLVGTGRLAQALGGILHRRGSSIRAVAGRDPVKAKEAAEFIGAATAVTIPEIGRYAQTVIIAVSDDAIAEIAGCLAGAASKPAVVLHTCGSIGPSVLQPLREQGASIGVLHPLQTVPTRERGLKCLVDCYYAVCGDPAAVARASGLIGRLGGRSLDVNADNWALYHAAAVLSINFQVALVDATLELWERAGISRTDALQALRPIVRAGVENVLADGPEMALSGPIRRGDADTTRRHLRALDGSPEEIRQLYLSGARRTLSLARRAGLAEEAASLVAKVLDGEETR